MKLSNYISICQAINLLFRPLVEVVIHDIKSKKIYFIDGEISNRKAGDDSFLGEINDEIEKVVYQKVNFDGKLVKSISILIKDNEQLVGLLCINCDVSVFKQMQAISNTFFASDTIPKLENYFNNDWQEKLHVAIHAKLVKKKWNFDLLTNSQKKEIIQYLFKQGAFVEKNAAGYIAKVLNMGRATIFNYLKEWRKNDD